MKYWNIYFSKELVQSIRFITVLDYWNVPHKKLKNNHKHPFCMGQLMLCSGKLKMRYRHVIKTTSPQIKCNTWFNMQSHTSRPSQNTCDFAFIEWHSGSTGAFPFTTTVLTGKEGNIWGTCIFDFGLPCFEDLHHSNNISVIPRHGSRIYLISEILVASSSLNPGQLAPQPITAAPTCMLKNISINMFWL